MDQDQARSRGRLTTGGEGLLALGAGMAGLILTVSVGHVNNLLAPSLQRIIETQDVA